jgi:malonyl-CoA O-methyltransferase
MLDCPTQSSLSRSKQAVADAFSRAAQNYDSHAEFQRQVGHQLLDMMPLFLEGKRVLDLGCGTGYFSQCIRERGAELVCGDISSQMLHQARSRCGEDRVTYSLCDAENLPFSHCSFDYVFSSLALQWCDDLMVPLKEISRVLKPQGQAYFSTLLDGSLVELKQAWAKVDVHQHVNRFISRNKVKLALAQSGNDSHHLSLATITLRYASAFNLMKDLKGIGATHVQGRAQGLVSRHVLEQVESAYRAICGVDDNLPATYQVCFGVLNR